MDDVFPDPGGGREDGLIWGPVGDPFEPGADVPGDTSEVFRDAADDNLWWYADDAVWDLGPADLDADGDGVSESLTSGVGGDQAILTDSDGDGRVDRISQIHADGTVTGRALADGGVEWKPTQLGRLE